MEVHRFTYFDIVRVHQMRSTKNRNMLRDYAWDIKTAGQCIKCGESDPRCLDFHHINPATKVDAISNMVRGAYSLDSLQTEIAKCNLICSNCHRKITSSH